MFLFDGIWPTFGDSACLLADHALIETGACSLPTLSPTFLRVHSRSTRLLADFPCGSQHLILHVRKCFWNHWAPFLKLRRGLAKNEKNILTNNKSCAKI